MILGGIFILSSCDKSIESSLKDKKEGESSSVEQKLQPSEQKQPLVENPTAEETAPKESEVSDVVKKQVQTSDNDSPLTKEQTKEPALKDKVVQENKEQANEADTPNEAEAAQVTQATKATAKKKGKKEKAQANRSKVAQNTKNSNKIAKDDNTKQVVKSESNSKAPVETLSIEEVRVGYQRPLSKTEIKYFKSQCRYAFMSEKDVKENRCETKKVTFIEL